MADAFLRGVCEGTVEVKRDRLAHETGNVWIEYQCRTAAGWTDSGIRTTKATQWLLIIGDAVYIGIPTDIVRAVTTKALKCPWLLSEEKDGSHPTRGVKVPLNLLWTWIRMELRRGVAT